MCCRTTISPLDPEVAASVLLVGQFVPQGNNVFTRRIEEENTTVTARFEVNALRLEISPSIVALLDHNGKRITAGVYFEIACKYAEKVDGKVQQLSNIKACSDANGGGQNVLVADYPEVPLSWDRVCWGFSELIANGHVHGEFDEPVPY